MAKDGTMVRVTCASLDALRRAVVAKHGKLRGPLMEEASAALLARAADLDRSVA